MLGVLRRIVTLVEAIAAAVGARLPGATARARDRRDDRPRKPRSASAQRPSSARRRRAARDAAPDRFVVRAVVGTLAVLGALIVFVPIKQMPDFLAERAIRQASSLSVGLRASSAEGRYRLTQWRELAPSNWKSQPMFKAADIAKLDDADPRAKAMLARMRSAWDVAPPNPALNGTAIRTAGYVVPIEQAGDGTREFLLVPYYGACIHTPPPPANQIIDVSVSRPLKNLDAMDTVWVDGVLQVARVDHEAGSSVYAMHADDVQPYAGVSR